jgi:hypothetical protein
MIKDTLTEKIISCAFKVHSGSWAWIQRNKLS